jgi:hypothetical protein
MTSKNDWMPGRRADALAMAANWNSQLALHATEWAVPQADVTALAALTTAAQTALAAVEGADRTEGAVQTCKTAFEALEAKMRDIKRRYFLEPPLTPTDVVNLGLTLPDTTKTEVPPPVDQAGIEVVKWAPHTLGLRLFTQASLGGDPASNYGIRVYYAPVEPGGTGAPTARRLAGEVFVLSAPPESPADLPNSFFTRKQRDTLALPAEASGKACYLAGRYENSKGQPGPFGSLVQANVP